MSFVRLSLATALALSVFTTEVRAEADVLNSIAAITSAVSPMAEAAIRSKADVDVARINADVAVKTTEISSETSKELARTQADIAKYQAMTAAQVNSVNQEGITERLGMQLSEIGAARRDSLQAQREAMLIEKEYNDAKIRLAEKESDGKIALAREQAKLQLTMAGLQTGTSYAKGNASRLSVRKNFLQQINSASNALASPATAAAATDTGAASAQAVGMPTGVGVKRQSLLAARTPSGASARKGASSRLLSSSRVRGGSALGSALRGVGAGRLSTSAMADAEKLLPSSVAGPRARGSFRGARVRVANVDMGAKPVRVANVDMGAKPVRVASASASAGGIRHRGAEASRGVSAGASGGHSHSGHSH